MPSVDFTPFNNYFDHIYVITLEREVDKQQRISDLLEGLSFEFFTGVDKKDFAIDDLIKSGIYNEEQAIALHRFNKPMNKGQIGCSWSHRNVYEDVIRNGYNKVLILEDDVIPQKEGFAELPTILAELPDSWELVYFDYCKNIKPTFASFFVVLYYHIIKILNRLKWSHKTISNLYTKKCTEHIRYAGYHDYTSAYAITATGAEKLIELQTPLAFTADNLLAHACSNQLVNGFITIPKTFAQACNVEKPSPLLNQVALSK